MANSVKLMPMDGVVARALRKPVSEDRAATAAVQQKILLVTSVDFIHRKSSENLTLPEVSEKVLQQLDEKYDQVIVLRVVDGSCAAYRLPEHPNLLFCDVDKSSVFMSMRNLVLLLKQEFQVEVKMPKDSRRLSWLNVGNYIDDERVRVVGGDGYERAGVVPDKDLSFTDMAKLRAQKSWI